MSFLDSANFKIGQAVSKKTVFFLRNMPLLRQENKKLGILMNKAGRQYCIGADLYYVPRIPLWIYVLLKSRVE